MANEDNKADLLRLAGEFADRHVDLYDLLGVDALTPRDDIHRAWRKRSLKHHPDKAGDKFDAATWELFERARDILSDDAARARYDTSIKAQLLRRQERDAMNKERRRFADDLEAREKAAMRQRREKEDRDRDMVDKERQRLAEEQRMREEERARQAEAAQTMDDLAEARRRLREKKEEKTRRRQAKESMRATTGDLAGGAANGLVEVPGNYLAAGDRPYWELVCDKLRAAQATRRLRAQPGAPAEALDEAEKRLLETRRRIRQAELQYERETAAV